CFFCFFFFFQAEDGIRDLTVTGVQTCALPIWRRTRRRSPAGTPSQSRSTPTRTRSRCRRRAPDAPCPASGSIARGSAAATTPRRSEERRVGKEGRARWAPDQYKKEDVSARSDR